MNMIAATEKACFGMQKFHRNSSMPAGGITDDPYFQRQTDLVAKFP
jgi:hypothetical protein